MTITTAQMLLDFEVGLMRNAFAFIDSQLEIVHKYIDEDFKREGDSALVTDSEYLHGLAFVTAQRYLTTSCSMLGISNKEKGKAFSVGPKVNAHVCYAAVVNAAANHWKHSDEWDFDNLKGQAKTTIQTIEAVGVEVSQYGGYVAGNDFAKLGLKKFSELTPFLTNWSDEVEKAFPR